MSCLCLLQFWIQTSLGWSTPTGNGSSHKMKFCFFVKNVKSESTQVLSIDTQALCINTQVFCAQVYAPANVRFSCRCVHAYAKLAFANATRQTQAFLAVLHVRTHLPTLVCTHAYALHMYANATFGLSQLLVYSEWCDINQLNVCCFMWNIFAYWVFICDKESSVVNNRVINSDVIVSV